MGDTEATMETAQNTVIVDLGPLRRSVEERVKSGSYASADEVIRAGLLALEREEAGTNEWLIQLGGRIACRSQAECAGGAGISGTASQVWQAGE